LPCLLVAGISKIDLAQAQVSNAPIEQKTQADHTEPNRIQAPAVAEGKEKGSAKNQEHCDNPEANNGPDICAQWVAANAARKSAELAQSSLIWNVLSFFALLFTLLVTAWGSRAAVRAAKAAESSTLNQQKSSELQLRAYLRVVPLALDRVRALTPFEVTNDGQTPASAIETRLNWHWHEPPIDLPADFAFHDKPGWQGKSIASLSAGQSITFTFPAFLDELRAVNEGRRSVFIYGHVDYTDIFGTKRKTLFCYQVTAGDAPERNLLQMLDRHNELT